MISSSSSSLPSSSRLVLPEFPENLSYPGWPQDKALAEQYYVEYGGSTSSTSSSSLSSPYTCKIAAMKNRQRLFEGDRSHPDLVALDTAVARQEFTYQGWEEDVEHALHIHCGTTTTTTTTGNTSMVGNALEKHVRQMQRQQAVHANRHAFGELQELDHLRATLSYEGLEADVAQAEELFVELDQTPSAVFFRAKLRAMLVKESIRGHKSDKPDEKQEAHPDIMALNSPIFSYPNWQADHQEAMDRIVGDCRFYHLGGFATLLEQMKRKQWVHDASSSSCSSTINTTTPAHPTNSKTASLEALDNLPLTYRGWEKDKQGARDLFYLGGDSTFFRAKVKALSVKQHILVEDKRDGDEHLVALDACHFSYPGWQAEKQKAQDCLTGDCKDYLLCDFPRMFQLMKRRQRLHEEAVAAAYYQEELEAKGGDGDPEKNISETDDETSTTGYSTCSSSSSSDESKASSTASINDTTECLKPKSISATTTTTRGMMCTVCLETQSTHAYIPCGHRCLCGDCAIRATVAAAEKHDDIKCPLCRTEGICITRIFL